MKSVTIKAGQPLNIGDLIWDDSGKAMGIVSAPATGDTRASFMRLDAGTPYEAVLSSAGTFTINRAQPQVEIHGFPHGSQFHRDYDAARMVTKTTLIIPGYMPLVFTIADEAASAKHEFFFKDGKVKSVEYFQDMELLGNAVVLPLDTQPVIRMKDMKDERKSFRQKKVEKEDGVLFNRSIRKHFHLDTFPRLKRFLSPELKRIVSQTA